jgi:hypothetical protein
MQMLSSDLRSNAFVDPDGRARRIAREILVYLMKQPDAKDSLEGIRQWWLDEPDRWSHEEVDAAAEELVKRGLLRVWESSPGSRIFGATMDFLRTPELFLHEFGSERLSREN